MDFKNTNQSWQVTFDSLPQDLETLKSLPQASLQEPYFGAALLISALCVWPQNQDEAVAMINFLKGPQALSVHEIQFINDRLRGEEYLPFSYFEGSMPQNDYQAQKPYRVTISTFPTSFDEEGYIKLYLRSNGADSLRPVQMRFKPSTGQWFLWDQMLLSQIREPISADPWS